MLVSEFRERMLEQEPLKLRLRDEFEFECEWPPSDFSHTCVVPRGPLVAITPP